MAAFVKHNKKLGTCQDIPKFDNNVISQISSIQAHQFLWVGNAVWQ